MIGIVQIILQSWYTLCIFVFNLNEMNILFHEKE